MVPKLTCSQRQYLGSSGSIGNPSSSTSSTLSSASFSSVLGFLTAVFLRGATFLFPTLTAIPPSLLTVADPGAGRLDRLPPVRLGGGGSGAGVLCCVLARRG